MPRAPGAGCPQVSIGKPSSRVLPGPARARGRPAARRPPQAAKRFFKRLLAGLKYKPRRIITDGLRSYGAAKREVLPEVRHRTSRYLNNRAENLYGAIVVKRSSLV